MIYFFVVWTFFGILAWILAIKESGKMTLEDLMMLPFCALCGVVALLLVLVLFGKRIIFWRKK